MYVQYLYTYMFNKYFIIYYFAFIFYIMQAPPLVKHSLPFYVHNKAEGRDYLVYFRSNYALRCFTIHYHTDVAEHFAEEVYQQLSCNWQFRLPVNHYVCNISDPDVHYTIAMLDADDKVFIAHSYTIEAPPHAFTTYDLTHYYRVISPLFLTVAAAYEAPTYYHPKCSTQIEEWADPGSP